MRRGIAATALVASLALAATACGGDTTDESGAKGGKSGGELAGTVTWWDTSTVGSEDKVFKALAEGFEKEHPKVKVNYVNVPFADAQNKFKNAASSGSGAPDVIRSEVAWTPDFASLGYLAPLDGTAALDKEDDYLKQAAASTKYDGKTFGVPQVIDSVGIFYNKKLLKEAGVEVPKTLDELTEAAKAIKSKTGKAALYLRGDDAYWFLSFLYGEGGDMINTKDKSVTIDDKPAIDAFKAVKELVDSKAAVTDATNGWDNMQKAIKDGEVAMAINGPWAVTDTLAGDAFKDKANFGVAPVPGRLQDRRLPAGRPQLRRLRRVEEPRRLLRVRQVHELRQGPGRGHREAQPAADARLGLRRAEGRGERDRAVLQAGRRDRRRAPLGPRGRQPLRAAADPVHQGPHRPGHARAGRQVHR